MLIKHDIKIDSCSFINCLVHLLLFVWVKYLNLSIFIFPLFRVLIICLVSFLCYPSRSHGLMSYFRSFKWYFHLLYWYLHWLRIEFCAYLDFFINAINAIHENAILTYSKDFAYSYFLPSDKWKVICLWSYLVLLDLFTTTAGSCLNRESLSVKNIDHKMINISYVIWNLL